MVAAGISLLISCVSLSLANPMYSPTHPRSIISQEELGGWNGDFRGLPQPPTLQGNNFPFKPYGLPPRRYDNKQESLNPMERQRRLYNEPQLRMPLLGRLPLRPLQLRPRPGPDGLGHHRHPGPKSQRFLPDMVNNKGNIKETMPEEFVDDETTTEKVEEDEMSPEGNPRKDWEFPVSVSQGHLGYPGGGGVHRQPPRRPKYDEAYLGPSRLQRWSDFYRGRKRGQGENSRKRVVRGGQRFLGMRRPMYDEFYLGPKRGQGENSRKRVMMRLMEMLHEMIGQQMEETDAIPDIAGPNVDCFYDRSCKRFLEEKDEMENNTEEESLPTENAPDEETKPEEFVDDETTTEKMEEDEMTTEVEEEEGEMEEVTTAKAKLKGKKKVEEETEPELNPTTLNPEE